MSQVQKSDMPSIRITFLLLLVHLLKKRAASNVHGLA